MKPTHELPALASIHLAAVHGGRDDLERARSAGAERRLHLDVADTGGIVLRHDLDRRHPRLEADHRQRKRDQNGEGREAEEAWAPPEQLTPAGEAR